MATPNQTQAISPTYNGPVSDAPNNPFLDAVNTWRTDDVADTKVMKHIRKKIANLKFWIDHPLTSEPYTPETLARLNQDLDSWNMLLIKAHYN